MSTTIANDPTLKTASAAFGLSDIVLDANQLIDGLEGLENNIEIGAYLSAELGEASKPSEERLSELRDAALKAIAALSAFVHDATKPEFSI